MDRDDLKNHPGCQKSRNRGRSERLMGRYHGDTLQNRVREALNGASPEIRFFKSDPPDPQNQ
jgi:hypothetical protein